MEYSKDNSIESIKIDINKIRGDEVEYEREKESYRYDDAIVVEKDGEYYRILDGEHRYKRAREEGMTEVLCKIWH